MERTEWSLRVLLDPTNFVTMQNIVSRNFQQKYHGIVYPFAGIRDGKVERNKLVDLHIASSDYIIWGTYWTSVISQPIEREQEERLLDKAAEAIQRYGVVSVSTPDILRRLKAPEPIGYVYQTMILQPYIRQADMHCILDCIKCCQDEDCSRHFGQGYQECMEECLKGCDIL